MDKQKVFAFLVLIGTLFSQMAGDCFADAAADLQVAENYQNGGLWQQAESAYKSVVQSYPGTEYGFKAQKALALLYISVDKDTKAQAAVNKLTTDFSSSSNLPSALNEIASTYRWTKKYQQTKDVYQKIIQSCAGSQQAGNAPLEIFKLDILALIDTQADSQAQIAIDNLVSGFSSHSHVAEVIYDIAQVYEWSGTKYEKAKSVYQQLIQTCPTSSFGDKAQIGIQRVEVLSAIDAGDVSRAQLETSKLKTSFSGSSYLPEALYEIANRYEWEAKNYTQAKSVYQDIAGQYSGNWCADKAKLDAPKADILIHIEAGEDSLAQSDIDQLISNFTGNSYLADVLYHIAIRYEEGSKYQKAKQTYQKVVQNCPNTTFATKAQLKLTKEDILFLIDSGDNTAAYAAIDAFIADNPANFHLTWILAQIADYCHEKAIKLEKQGLPDQVNQYLQKAKRIWQNVIEDTPACPYTIPHALSMAGDCCRRLGDYQKSIEYYQQLVDNYPEHSAAWNSLFMIGRCYENMLKAGQMSMTEADVIRVVYEDLLCKYPHSQASVYARNWLETYELNMRRIKASK